MQIIGIKVIQKEAVNLSGSNVIHSRTVADKLNKTLGRQEIDVIAKPADCARCAGAYVREYLVNLKNNRSADVRHTKNGTLGYDNADFPSHDPLNRAARGQVAEVRKRRGGNRVVCFVTLGRPPDTVRPVAIAGIVGVAEHDEIPNNRNMASLQGCGQVGEIGIPHRYLLGAFGKVGRQDLVFPARKLPGIRGRRGVGRGGLANLSPCQVIGIQFVKAPGIANVLITHAGNVEGFDCAYGAAC